MELLSRFLKGSNSDDVADRQFQQFHVAHRFSFRCFRKYAMFLGRGSKA